MKVVLLRKLAERMDGVDVTGREVGDVLDLPPHEAHALLAERWAISERRERESPPPAGERRRSRTGESPYGGDVHCAS
jgi:hypothetical protein